MQSVFQVPVKMGSHKLVIDLESSSDMTTVQFIELVLKKCKLTSNEKTYSVFESVNGVEKMLKSNEIVTDVWKYWLNQSVPYSVQFIVRKCVSVEKKLAAISESEKRKQMIKKCYKKINSDKTNQSPKQDKHELKSKRDYLKKIVENEEQLKKQSEQLLQIEALLQKLTAEANKQIEQSVPQKETSKQSNKPNKLCSYHQNSLINNLNEKFSDNINFLQFLYLKLKKQNSSQNKSFSYEKLIDNNSCGNSSAGEDYDSSSNRSSRTTSTSTLESLV